MNDTSELSELKVPIAESWPVEEVVETFGEWRNNSLDNPFFKSQTPVDVKTTIGTIRRIKCPRCGGSGMMALVTEWRPVTKKTMSKDHE